MKIALISIFMPANRKTGGVSYVAHNLANALVDRGHQVTVFTFDAAPDQARYAIYRMPVAEKWREKPKLKRLLTGFLSPFHVLRAQYGGFDLIHAFGDDQLLFLKNTPVLRTFLGTAYGEAKASFATGRKLGGLLQLILYPMEFVSLLAARRSVGISHATVAALPGVQEVIPVGLDPAVFHPGHAKSPEPSILFIGTLEGRKRGQMMLRVFREEIRPALPEAKLWMGIERDVREPGVTSFLNLPTEELADLYRKAWVYCSTSCYEGFGVPYIEAMASGTAVVSTDNPGAREVLNGPDGPAGTVCRDEEVGRCLMRVLSDAEKRRSLVERGLRRSRDFLLTDVARRYEEIYHEILNTKHA